MLPRQDKFRVDSPDNTPPIGKRSATIKSRLISLRDHKTNDNQQCYTNIAMENIFDESGHRLGTALTVEVLKTELRHKLIKPLRLLRTESYQYMNVEHDNLAEAFFVNDEEKNYALLWAAFCGDLELLRNLHLQGADVNFVHPIEYLNALHLSALTGSVECTQWLLTKGCKIVNNAEGNSPLHYAVLGNTQRICRYLIESGCRIDPTALHAAVQANSLDCIEYLLCLAVPVNAFDAQGMTALHIAADIGNIRILRQLLNDKRLDINIKTKEKKYTALHLAAENGYAGCLKMLLEKGAYVDELSAKKQTPLYLACKQTFVDCVDLLLDHGAAVNVQDIERRSPLHAALCKSPHALHIVQRLVEREADVNLADDYGYAALHIAALNELEECVEFLIMKGANVAAKTQGHVTALNIINRKTPVSSGKIFDRLNLQLAYTEAQSLKFNFRDVIKNSSVGEIGYLYTLQKEGLAKVLEHPLCEGYLHLKWQKVRLFILVRAAIGLITVTLLSVFVLWGITKGCYNVVISEDMMGNMSTNSWTNSSAKLLSNSGTNSSIDLIWAVGNCTENSIVGTVLKNNGFLLPVIWYTILVVLAVNSVRLVFTLAAYRSAKHFFCKYSNMLEIIVTICVLLLTWRDQDGKTLPWQEPVGSLTILFSWAYIMIMVGQLPSIGTYVAMFTKVLKEFLKMIVAFLCLLMGFTFTFCILKKDQFHNPVVGFAKIMAMMTGELNINDLLTAETESIDPQANLGKYTTIFVLCLFMIIITIVLMNLLVGIAVNDVEGLRKTADLSKLIQQTKLIHFLERTCFKGFFPPRVMDILKKLLYTWPDSYTVVIYVRPLSPHEKRLPRDVMERGLKIALTRARKRMEAKNRKPSTDQRIEALQNHILKLQDMLQGLQESMLSLTNNNNFAQLNTIDEVNDCDNDNDDVLMDKDDNN